MLCNALTNPSKDFQQLIISPVVEGGGIISKYFFKEISWETHPRASQGDVNIDMCLDSDVTSIFLRQLGLTYGVVS